MRCTARRRDGEQCRSNAIAGGNVCRMHGGGAPQVKRKAAERIKEVRDLAIDRLKEQIETKARNADPRTMLAAVKELSELVETLEGRVARREGVEVDDLAGSRERLAQQLARISERSGTGEADSVSD
jgi:hypothetical protein